MAIQVNGTQVIGNSRELTNIASVDATTATAIGAAGVGGGLKLLQNYTTTSNATYFDIDFPSGYDWIKIAIGSVRVTDTQYSGTLLARFKNSSGLITSASYLYMKYSANSVGPNLQNSLYIEMKAFLSGSTGGNNASVEIINPRDSASNTLMSFKEMGYGTFQVGYGNTAFGGQQSFALSYPEVNTGIRIYDDSTKTIKAGVKIKVWGAVNA